MSRTLVRLGTPIRDIATGRVGQTRSTGDLGPHHGPATSDGRAAGPQRVMVTWADGAHDDVLVDLLDGAS